MDIEDNRDSELVARSSGSMPPPGSRTLGFDYEGLIDRHAARQARARRRLALARGTASALVIAMVGVERLALRAGAGDERRGGDAPESSATAAPPQPRIVRADTYLAVAALEDHIASIDDALNDARLRRAAPPMWRAWSARARLLVDSYAQCALRRNGERQFLMIAGDCS